MTSQPKPQQLKRSKADALIELKRMLLAERAERRRQAGGEERPTVPETKPTDDRA